MKHRAVGNSIKVYDKGGSILRIETTINNPKAYRSYRSSEAERRVGAGWKIAATSGGEWAAITKETRKETYVMCAVLKETDHGQEEARKRSPFRARCQRGTNSGASCVAA